MCRKMATQAAEHANNQHSKTSLKSDNLNKLPSTSPLREYLLSKEARIGGLSGTGMEHGGSMTVSELDSFMQRATENKIVDEAKGFVEGYNSDTHRSWN